jgi:hypothetical protein
LGVEPSAIQLSGDHAVDPELLGLVELVADFSLKAPGWSQ